MHSPGPNGAAVVVAEVARVGGEGVAREVVAEDSPRHRAGLGEEAHEADRDRRPEA